ncbi:hypothetical protein [Enterobacter sp. Bisph1]|uniref:hypothetical protein n=1 Tax=Enterobacter sp. Bisph1 TaxID=1274399 RepID=UPI00057C1C4B|nr:hypothetical protein [Enterobacter sp. Bisph1]
MKWNRVVILIIDIIDRVIETTVLNSRMKYPDSYVVCKHAPGDESSLDNYEVANKKCLSESLDIYSKLIIVAHGKPYRCGSYSASRLAIYLKYLGVKNVGLISFKSCHIGVGNFLEEFEAECRRMFIFIGWCLGYKGSMTPFRGHLVIDEFPLDKLLRYSSCDLLKLPDSSRIKVIRGAAIIPNCFRIGLGRRFPQK